MATFALLTLILYKMEYTLYFDFRKVTVSDDDPCCTCDASALLLFNPDDKSFETAYNLFLNEKSYSSLYIKTDRPDHYTRLLQKNFTLINAAGGVIENENGEILMIFRNGKWDLPKGKQEEGEAIEETAVREVQEECSISTIETGELLCITHHTYNMNGEDTLKDTYWYKMKTSSTESLKPQMEEGIDEVRWFSKPDLASIAQNTWPSVTNVLTNIK